MEHERLFDEQEGPHATHDEHKRVKEGSGTGRQGRVKTDRELFAFYA